MKLTTLCLLAALLVGAGSVMAQDERRDYSEQRLKLRAEMMALDMAERYNLDEKQVVTAAGTAAVLIIAVTGVGADAVAVRVTPTIAARHIVRTVVMHRTVLTTPMPTGRLRRRKSWRSVRRSASRPSKSDAPPARPTRRACRKS